MGMQYRNFGKTGKKLSVLGFGAMRLPLIDKSNPGSIDVKKSIQMIRYAIDHGLNYIDTAYPYHSGQSENLVAKVIENGYRQRTNIADKLPCWQVNTTDDFDRLFKEQLKKLDQPDIDFYLLHALNQRTWQNVYDLGVLDWLEKQKKEGKIKFYGFSFHDKYPAFDTILNSFKWDFCQIQLNYLDTGRDERTSGSSQERSWNYCDGTFKRGKTGKTKISH
jgi:predicted aldo/keto reductase-like oxidoreductase